MGAAQQLLAAYSAAVAGVGVHRYWRIDQFTLGAGTVFVISELRMFAAAADVTPGTYTSPRALDAGNFGNLVDGNLTNSATWVGTIATMDIRADFGAGTEKQIDGIKVCASDDPDRMLTGFRLSYSDDGTTFTPVGSCSGIAYPGNFTLTPLITVFV